MKQVITFNKQNECSKQDGIAPNQIIYVGKIEDVPEPIIYEHFGSYKDFFYECRDAKEDEDCCVIIKESEL